MWLLTVIFACGISCGGVPPQVDIGLYASYQSCSQAGLPYIMRAGNPMKTVKTYTCHLQRN